MTTVICEVWNDIKDQLLGIYLHALTSTEEPIWNYLWLYMYIYRSLNCKMNIPTIWPFISYKTMYELRIILSKL